MGLIGAIRAEYLRPKINELQRKYDCAFYYYRDMLNVDTDYSYGMSEILEYYKRTQSEWESKNSELRKKREEVDSLWYKVVELKTGKPYSYVDVEFQKAYHFDPIPHPNLPASRWTEIDSYIIRLKDYLSSHKLSKEAYRDKERKCNFHLHLESDLTYISDWFEEEQNVKSAVIDIYPELDCLRLDIELIKPHYFDNWGVQVYCDKTAFYSKFSIQDTSNFLKVLQSRTPSFDFSAPFERNFFFKYINENKIKVIIRSPVNYNFEGAGGSSLTTIRFTMSTTELSNLSYYIQQIIECLKLRP